MTAVVPYFDQHGLALCACQYPRCTNNAEYHRSWVGTDRRAYCPDHDAMDGREPIQTLLEAIGRSQYELDRPIADFAPWPWQTVTDEFGVLAPGTVTYIAAHTGNGKTKFIMQAAAWWGRAGYKVWMIPTEARADGYVRRLCCEKLGFNADDVMSHSMRMRAEQGDEKARASLLLLREEYARISRATIASNATDIWVEREPLLSLETFRESCRAAAQAGCKIIIVDHCDFIGGKGNIFQVSQEIQYAALAAAVDYDLILIMMSQLNNRLAAADPLYRYKQPMLEHLWMKGPKDQIAVNVVGLFRPIDPDLTVDEIKTLRDGPEHERSRIALPFSMGVAKMKSRFFGDSLGTVSVLGIENGYLVDLSRHDRILRKRLP